MIPVFVRDGAIVPRSEPAQDANGADCREMEISVYTGANARFTLYEDHNETYDYERGIYRAVDLDWNERSKTLTLPDARGAFRPTYDRQTFTIRVISPGPDGKTEIIRRKTDYIGKKMKPDSEKQSGKQTSRTEKPQIGIFRFWFPARYNNPMTATG